MPSHNYTVNIMINNGNKKLISIILIDTILLCGNTEPSINPLKKIKNKKIPMFKSDKDKKLAELFLKDLEDKFIEISFSNVSYIIVGGHFPILSAGENGPNKFLIEKLMPLLHKYKVSAYFSGHDHSLQHISHNYMNTQVEYFITGAGSSSNTSNKYINNIPKNSLKFKWPNKIELTHGGFLLVEANENRMIVNFMKADGTNLYKKTILSRE